MVAMAAARVCGGGVRMRKIGVRSKRCMLACAAGDCAAAVWVVEWLLCGVRWREDGERATKVCVALGA